MHQQQPQLTGHALVARPGGFFDVLYNGELVAENVTLTRARELVDFYEFTEKAIDAAAFGLTVPADEMAMLSPRCRGVHLN